MVFLSFIFSMPDGVSLGFYWFFINFITNMIWLILFCPRKKKINSKSITSRAAAYLKETEEPNKYKKVSECLEGLQDAYVREQAYHQVKRPPGEGERRTSFIKLETDCCWRWSWGWASRVTKPAELTHILTGWGLSIALVRAHIKFVAASSSSIQAFMKHHIKASASQQKRAFQSQG